MNDTERVINGRLFVKAVASSNGGGCVGLPRYGRDGVADYKTNQVLVVPVAGLVAWAKRQR